MSISSVMFLLLLVDDGAWQKLVPIEIVLLREYTVWVNY